MCYCGDEFTRQPVLAADQSGRSSVVCAGDSTAYCGAVNTLQVYAALSASGSLLVTSTVAPLSLSPSSAGVSTGPASVTVGLGAGGSSSLVSGVSPSIVGGISSSPAASVTIGLGLGGSSSLVSGVSPSIAAGVSSSPLASVLPSGSAASVSSSISAAVSLSSGVAGTLSPLSSGAVSLSSSVAGAPAPSSSGTILPPSLSASGAATSAGLATSSSASATGTEAPLPPGAFRLFVQNNVSGLDALAVGFQGGQVVVGAHVQATVLEITNATNMTDLSGNVVYFIPPAPAAAPQRLADSNDTQPSLLYGPNPPPGAVTSGFSLDFNTLGSNSTSGNYTFYTCNVTPDAQPIYVAEVGHIPGSCFGFDLVTTPPPLNNTNSTTSSASAAAAATSSGAAPSSSAAAPSSAGVSLPAAGSASGISSSAAAATSSLGASSSPVAISSSALSASPSSAGVSIPVAGSISLSASSPATSITAVSASSVSLGPTVVASARGFTNQGLFADPGGFLAGGTPGGTSPSATSGSSSGSATSPLLADASTSSASLTVQSCGDFCSGFNYFGLENGDVCLCGNDFTQQPRSASPSDQSGASDVVCSGDYSSYCGGANLLQVYAAPGVSSLMVTATASSSGASSASPMITGALSSGSITSNQGSTLVSSSLSSPSVSPTVVSTVAGFNVRALFNDPGGVPGSGGSTYPSATGGISGGSPTSPLLADRSITSSGMNVNICAGFCSGSNYFGIENGMSIA